MKRGRNGEEWQDGKEEQGGYKGGGMGRIGRMKRRNREDVNGEEWEWWKGGIGRMEGVRNVEDAKEWKRNVIRHEIEQQDRKKRKRLNSLSIHSSHHPLHLCFLPICITMTATKYNYDAMVPHTLDKL